MRALTTGRVSADESRIDQIESFYRAVPKLTSERVRAVYQSRLGESEFATSPVFVSWAVTSSCNQGCHHCFVRSKYVAAMQNEDLTRIASDLAESGVLAVRLEGGEPLMSSALLDIVRTLKGAGVTITLLTNGTLLSRSRIQQLCAMGMGSQDTIQVSLDAVDESAYKAIRDTDPGIEILEVLEMLQDSPMQCIAHAVPTTLNATRVVAVLDAVLRFPRLAMTTAPLYPTGRPGDGLSLRLDEKIRIEGELVVRDGGRYAYRGRMLSDYDFIAAGRIGSIGSSERPRYRCAAGVTDMHIAPDGSAYPCVFAMAEPWRAGTAPAKDIRALWRTDAWRDLRRGYPIESIRCGTCEYADRCSKGCIGASIPESGVASLPDPRCAK